jgi:hypothetical protein
MKMGGRIGVLVFLAGSLFLISGAVPAAATASGASQAAQNAFVKKIDDIEPTVIPDQEIAKLGGAICQLLQNGRVSPSSTTRSLCPPKQRMAVHFHSSS